MVVNHREFPSEESRISRTACGLNLKMQGGYCGHHSESGSASKVHFFSFSSLDLGGHFCPFMTNTVLVQSIWVVVLRLPIGYMSVDAGN